ncbi:MAG: sugar transferase [Devosiaceae bacterium]|nr:sugar transferase [Devosiaceae bacterium MH13]
MSAQPDHRDSERTDGIVAGAAKINRDIPRYVFDKLLSFSILVVASPLMVLAGLLVFLGDFRNPIFAQERAGYGGGAFTLYKIRTMTVGGDGAEFHQAHEEAGRITPVGRVLRRYKIDELPQLLNVLAGDMSLVGPRPYAMHHEAALEARDAHHSLRRLVRPGLTGYAQVNGCHGPIESPEQAQRRLDWDLAYLADWSLALDVQIVMRTGAQVFRELVAFRARPQPAHVDGDGAFAALLPRPTVLSGAPGVLGSVEGRPDNAAFLIKRPIKHVRASPLMSLRDDGFRAESQVGGQASEGQVLRVGTDVGLSV